MSVLSYQLTENIEEVMSFIKKDFSLTESENNLISRELKKMYNNGINQVANRTISEILQFDNKILKVFIQFHKYKRDELVSENLRNLSHVTLNFSKNTVKKIKKIRTHLFKIQREIDYILVKIDDPINWSDYNLTKDDESFYNPILWIKNDGSVILKYEDALGEDNFGSERFHISMIK